MNVIDAPWTTPPTLRGRHVALEPLRPGHASGLRDAVQDGRLWELWFTSIPRPDAMDAYVADALAGQANGAALPFVVRDGDGRIVGSTRYYELAPATPRLLVGYTWYARSVQRTALNTEAKLLLLTHAFEQLRCASVGLQTSTHNQVSRAAIARLGAVQEGILRNHLRHQDGSLRDTVNFSIIDGEWAAVKTRLQARLEVSAHG